MSSILTAEGPNDDQGMMSFSLFAVVPAHVAGSILNTMTVIHNRWHAEAKETVNGSIYQIFER